MKKNIFYLREDENYEKDTFGYAISPDEVDSGWVYQGEALKSNEDEEDRVWEIPIFDVDYGKLPDYLDNDCKWTLCSTRMKEVIDKHANNSSEIEWVNVQVKHGNTITPYYAILIEDALSQNEAVDYDKSKKLQNGEVYLPHFNYSYIKDKDVFAVEDYNKSIFISENFKNILEREGLTGLGFEDWYAS